MRKSIYKGVSWDKDSSKWRSVLNYNKKSYTVGRFESEKDAAIGYNNKAREVIGCDASFNVIGVGFVIGEKRNGILSWSDEDIELLTRLYETNMIVSRIAERLGRTAGATRVMAWKLGLSKRDNHSMSHTRPYRIWRAMRSRIYNKNNERYERYGGRGIEICKEWETFTGFWNDMKQGYSDELSIGRINNEEGYNKNNCRWETREQQDNNTSRTVWLEHNGETKSLTQWANEFSINPKTLEGRIKSGWSVEVSLSTPVGEIRGVEK